MLPMEFPIEFMVWNGLFFIETGGLAAYFKAYPTVKFINKTIITPQRLPPPSAVTPVKDPPKKQIVTGLFGMHTTEIFHIWFNSIKINCFFWFSTNQIFWCWNGWNDVRRQQCNLKWILLSHFGIVSILSVGIGSDNGFRQGWGRKSLWNHFQKSLANWKSWNFEKFPPRKSWEVLPAQEEGCIGTPGLCVRTYGCTFH